MTNKKNTNLHKAKKDKQDEFYTQKEDVEAELKHYKTHFKDKVVYCNCDDPYKSSYFKYFFLKFDELGLKKLMATCYKSQDPEAPSQNNSKQAIYLEYVSGKTGILDEELKKIKIHNLKGDGDFRSEECIELLKQADIVVTNPPFSLFREYVAQLIKYDKKFLIIGSQMAITYKEIYSLIHANKVWLGYGNKKMTFKVPASYTGTFTNAAGETCKSLGNVCWYTNLTIDKRNDTIDFYKKYADTPEDYPKYDNYDAIDVGEVKKIPGDYTGELGVPITFLNKHNPNQFDLIRFRKGNDDKDLMLNGKCGAFRIIIKRKV